MRTERLLLAALILLAACTDKAQEPFDQGKAAEAKGDLQEAIRQYEAAVTAAPKSKAGSEAALRIPVLKLKLKQETETAAKASPQRANKSEDVKTVADALREHPEYLLDIPYETRWADRVRAHVVKPTSEQACPAIKEVSGDEFDRRDGIAQAVAACKESNEKALDIVKKCPVVMRFDMAISKYDFNAKMFELTYAENHKPYVSNEGHVWFRWNGGSLLSWPGVYAAKNSPKADRELMAVACSGPLINNMPVVAGLVVPLRLPEDAAKALRGSLGGGEKVRVDLAYVLDGGSAQDHYPCGMTDDKPIATGRVIGWRMQKHPVENPPVVIRDWEAVAPWTPDPSCADAGAFFSPAAVADAGVDFDAGAADRSTKKAAIKAVAGKKSCDDRCAEMCMRDAPEALAPCLGQCQMMQCGRR